MMQRKENMAEKNRAFSQDGLPESSKKRTEGSERKLRCLAHPLVTPNKFARGFCEVAKPEEQPE